MEKRVSARPKGSIRGIQPESSAHRSPTARSGLSAVSPRAGAPHHEPALHLPAAQSGTKRTKHTLSILQSPHLRTRHVLLDHAALHPVYIARLVYLGNERPGFVCCLGTGEDVKVVVGSVSARVTFGAYSRAKDDEIPTCQQRRSYRSDFLQWSPWCSS